MCRNRASAGFKRFFRQIPCYPTIKARLSIHFGILNSFDLLLISHRFRGGERHNTNGSEAFRRCAKAFGAASCRVRAAFFQAAEKKYSYRKKVVKMSPWCQVL